MFGGFSLSSLTNSLSELTSTINQSISHVSESVSQVIDQSIHSFEAEEAKNAALRTTKQSASQTNHPMREVWFTQQSTSVQTNDQTGEQSVNQTSDLKSRILLISKAPKNFLQPVPESYYPIKQAVKSAAKQADKQDNEKSTPESAQTNESPAQSPATSAPSSPKSASQTSEQMTEPAYSPALTSIINASSDKSVSVLIDHFSATCLELDGRLQLCRYRLVPRRMKEEKFWRSYFFMIESLRCECGAESLMDVVKQFERSEQSSDDSSKHQHSNDAATEHTNEQSILKEALMPLAMPVAKASTQSSSPKSAQSTEQTISRSSTPSNIPSTTQTSTQGSFGSGSRQSNQTTLEIMHSFDEPEEWASDEFESMHRSANPSSDNQSKTAVNQAVLNDLDSLLDEIDNNDDDDINEDALLQELEGLDDKDLP